MLYILFATSYILDFIILVFFIALFLSLAQLIKSLGEKYSFLEKFKITPELIVKNPAQNFDKFASKDDKGTFITSYNQHKKINKKVKRIIKGMLGFLAIKILLICLILLDLPRPSEAQLKQNQYQDKDYFGFSKGTYNLTSWEGDGLTLKSGQLTGNFISQPIGDGNTVNQWQTLSWQTDKKYNQKPEYPKETLVVWSLDSLESCADPKYQKYNCLTSKVDLKKGIYYSAGYNFNGNNSSAKIPANIDFADSFTIGAWIKPAQNILNGSQDINYTIFAKAYGDYTASDAYELTNNIFFGIKEGSLQIIYWSDKNRDHWTRARDTNYDFIKDKWVFVAGVFDKKNKSLKIYIDSFDQTDVAEDYDSGILNHLPASTTYPSWLGSTAYRWQDKNEKIINVFDGTIDEVFIINKALDPLELRSFVSQAAEIYFQVRTSDFLPLTGPFWGPGGKTNSYFSQPTTNNLQFLIPSKYLQYIVFISRPNTNFFPKIYSVNVDYLIPEANNFKITVHSEQKISPQIPVTRDLNKEMQAIQTFNKFFKTNPKSQNDWEFVNLIAYNQVNKRNLDKEITAVIAYIKYYKKLPKTNADWGLIKALAYNPKGEELMAAWRKKK